MRLKQLETLIESSKKHALFEGVKIGKKEIEETLNNSADFQMGIEYEILMPDGGRVEEAQEFITQQGIKYVAEVVPEHNRMTEIITEVMPIPTGIKHIKSFFEKAHANGITFPRTAGLHISISHKHYDKKDINLTKFLVLLSGDYLHSLFPEREYVKSIETRMRKILKTDKKRSVTEMEKEIEDLFSSGPDRQVKYITAKISDYINMDGRIELRFVGGENYNEQFNEIRWQVLRAVYILAIAYEPDMFRKEYLKTLYSYTHGKRLPDDFDLSNTSPSDALRLSREYDSEELINIIATDANSSYRYAMDVIQGAFKKGEAAISTNARASIFYASMVLHDRFKQGEDAIATNPKYSYEYANEILKGRFEKGEATIATSAEYSAMYALDVIGGRFEQGEDAIMTDDHPSYVYSRAIKGRFKKGEAAIFKHSQSNMNVAINYLAVVEKYEGSELAGQLMIDHFDKDSILKVYNTVVAHHSITEKPLRIFTAHVFAGDDEKIESMNSMLDILGQRRK